MTFYNEKGLKRLFNAILFSMAGFKATWKNEEAFRLEVILFVVSTPLAIWLGESTIEKILLIASVVMVLIVEIVNSAIEAVVDRSGHEYHELSGRAKDMGSAAVFLTLLLALAIWLSILFVK
ncbi:MAG: diacylglycerol kinase [Methylococcales bacterium]|nr:diacylglycerol kinase [Methylococcales bacterium]